MKDLIQIKTSLAHTSEEGQGEIWQPKPIYEQVEVIAQEFCLSAEETLKFLQVSFSKAILPPEAYGWFAIPTIDAVAEHFFPGSKDSVENYQRSSKLVLDKISQKFWEFENLDCKSTPDKFFLPEKTRLALENIRIYQQGPILIIPVRFNTKVSDVSGSEFPLGSFFTACLGLTHPERYSQTKPEVLDESNVECIGFGKVSCRTCWFDDARTKWNKATGFIPKFKGD